MTLGVASDLRNLQKAATAEHLQHLHTRHPRSRMDVSSLEIRRSRCVAKWSSRECALARVASVSNVTLTSRATLALFQPRSLGSGHAKVRMFERGLRASKLPQTLYHSMIA